MSDPTRVENITRKESGPLRCDGAVPAPRAHADGEALPEAETTSLCDWIKERLTASVDSVRPGKRLVGSPALVLTPEGEMTPQMRQMMKMFKGGGAKKMMRQMEAMRGRGGFPGM